MDLSIIKEFLELFKKFDGLQDKIFETNAVWGVLTLKGLIKVMEGLLNKLKQKEEFLLKQQEEDNSSTGIKLNKWKKIINKINL